MTAKDCGRHDEESEALKRRVVYGIGGFLALVFFSIFLVWAILRPTKPSFILREATVYVFNISTSPDPYSTLTTTMQVTVSSKNSMDRVGIYYQKLDIYATYRSQQITIPTLLPTAYQGTNEISEWSPFLYGTAVPVWPGLLVILQQDLNVGGVLLNVKINGNIKWQVSTWISGNYQLNVNCPAYIKFGDQPNPGPGIPSGPVPLMKFELAQSCSVNV